jgi:hypothetical protein
LRLARHRQQEFAELTNRDLRRTGHGSVTEFEVGIRSWLSTRNAEPSAFALAKAAGEVLDSIAAYGGRIKLRHSSTPCNITLSIRSNGPKVIFGHGRDQPENDNKWAPFRAYWLIFTSVQKVNGLR